MEVLVRSYTEEGFQEIPEVRLPDEEYGRALQCLVPSCADIVPINVDERVIYLARRSTRPMTGWWWIGGRMAANETKEQAAMRNFGRETGIKLSPDRLKLVSVFDYRWKNRAQVPRDIGCHMVVYTFVTELTAEELTALTLDRGEYDLSSGLTAFSRERLVAENVFPAIRDLYDHVFGSRVG